MNDSDRRELDEHGFMVAERFLDRQSVGRLVSEIALVDDSAGRDEAAAAVRVRRGVAFARRNLLGLSAVTQFLNREEIREVAGRFSPGAIPVRAILFDKSGGANWTVPWHQDRSIAVRVRRDVAGFGPWSIKAGVAHVQPPEAILQRMVTLRFSLDACGPANGPLRVIPGTHTRILTASEVEAAARDVKECLCTTDEGGLVVMRPLVLHASSPAVNTGHRRVLHVEFAPADLPGGLEWALA